MSYFRDKRCGRVSVLVLVLLVGVSCAVGDETVEEQEGDLSRSGGSPTVRAAYEAQEDDPATTNDESNDQPIGHFGTLTMSVSNMESGNFYTLDVEMEGLEAQRIYFPRGGWVDFYTCELDSDLTGTCMDEEGRTWFFYGASDAGASALVSEEFDQDLDGQAADEDGLLSGIPDEQLDDGDADSEQD